MNLEDLILKYYTGTLSSDEQVLFDESRGNKEFERILLQYQDLDLVLNTISDKRQDSEWNTQTAWDSMEGILHEIPTAPVQKLYSRKIWMRVAAAIVFLAASIFFLKTIDKSPDMDLSLLAHENLVHELSDGSLVYMDEGSSIKISSEYNESSRKLEASGKVFFVVKPNKDKVFEVETNHLNALVMGTSFEFSENSGLASVAVHTGIVKVKSGSVTNILTKGDKLNWRNGQIELLKASIGNPWMSEVMNFRDVSLSSIITHVDDFYQTTVKVDDSFLDKKYTVSFEDLDIEEVVTLLARLTQTSIQKNSEGYLLN